MARTRRVRAVNVGFRLAGTDDAAALSALGAETFTETFGHLYQPADLAAFLTTHGEDHWRQELADREFAVLIAETESGEAVLAQPPVGST